MIDRSAEREQLFDAAAEALVLVDCEDAESVTVLVERLHAIERWFGETADDHPIRRAIAAAQRLDSGGSAGLAELEQAYTDARSRALAGESSTAAPENARTMPLAGDAELLRDFGVRAYEHLDDADEYLIALEAEPAHSASIHAVFRAFHTIKGMAGFLSLDAVAEHAHASESLLAGARENDAALRPDEVQALFSAVDTMRTLVEEATGLTPATGSSLPEGDTSAQIAVAVAREVAHGGARMGTIRVDEHRLDQLLDMIGELVIAETMVSSAVRTGDDHAGAQVRVERLDKITRELQSMATSLRMVSLRATFQRMSRLVRDLSHRSGKPIELTIEGEDTELDKAVVDQMTDPLIHALRNAVDHGIEDADERLAAGKTAAGHVTLRAYHAGGSIVIEIADDGRGLDAERILARARDRGLIGDEPLGPAEIAELVFAPGFSTAETVSDVSGRGVGMDVVRRTVEELRGRVDLDSEPGHGTTLTIRLPLTLAIIDGMVARVAEERYVIPLLSIERSVRPTPEQLTTVAGRGEMLTLPDGLLPVLRLHRLFGCEGAEEDPTQAVVMVTSENGVRAGLMACELLGQQQTVIKPLGDGLLERPGITGGAIMPDGHVGLILDAAGLIRLAHEQGGA